MRGLVCGLLVLALVGSGCGEPRPEESPEPAIPFEVERLEGGPVSLADYEGTTLLVDFWATWCPPCVLEIPELNAFYAEHRDDGVELLAIAVDEDDPEALARWAEENGIEYPVALGSERLARAYGATGFPYHVLISPDGTVLERLTPGYHDREQFAALVARHR